MNRIGGVRAGPENLGHRKRKNSHLFVLSFVLSFFVVIGFCLLFHHLLGVPLPKGTWFE